MSATSDDPGRITRSKETARASYNRLSQWYDALAGSSEQECVAAGLRQLNISPGEKVLEIGFGTGNSLVALAQAVGATGKVWGIDLSEGMLKRARAKVKAAGFAEKVELKNGDAAHLPFEANTFDAAFMSFTLELFDTPEIAVVLDECRRVLQAGGRMGVVAMSKTDTPGTAARLYDWAHLKFPAVVDCRPIPVRASIATAGFQIMEAISLAVWGLPVEVVTGRKAE